MDFILPLAAKSLLIAGITLLVLKAMHRRSAAPVNAPEISSWLVSP